MNKLALGSAQFGLKYGINNRRGKVPPAEVLEILKYCISNGINVVDTAAVYGKSEKVLGQCFKKISLEKFHVISKAPKSSTKLLRSFFFETLKDLNVSHLYGYLIHDFDFFLKNKSSWKILTKLKREGFVKKIGFSLYSPIQIETLFSFGIYFDIVQVPYNVLDQRFDEMFLKLKKRGIEIHVRSAFLQGLLFKKPEDLSLFFYSIKSKIARLNDISKENNISIPDMLLGFVNLNKNIDKIVVGIDSLDQLKSNLEYEKHLNKIKKIYSQLKEFSEIDERIILPSNWPK